MHLRDFLKCLGALGVGASLLNPNPAAAAPPLKTGPSLLFDSWSTQVLDQQASTKYPPNFTPRGMTQSGHRISTILSSLKSYGEKTGGEVKGGYNISFTQGARIDSNLLKGIQVYISLTRYQGTSFAYREQELQALHDFVHDQGGNILLHTNHGPPPGPGKANDDYTQNDKALAKKFGITLEPYFVTYTTEYKSEYMKMNVTKPSSKLNKFFDSDFQYISNRASTIASHDSCIITPPKKPYAILAEFPEGTTVFNRTLIGPKAIPLKNSGLSKCFAILVPYGKGNVIVVGNSGMLSNYGSIGQSTGLIPMENNLMFFLNCVSYLAGYSEIPTPGFGPSGPYLPQ
jgi:hypothetical protein